MLAGLRRLALLAALWPAAARAKPNVAVGVGAFGPLPLATPGLAAQAEVYPRGAFGRFGLRVAYAGQEGVEPALVTGGVTWEAAATRPHLQIALHADVGGASDGRIAAGGGVQAQLWLWPPFALGLDATVFLLHARDFAVGSVLTARVSF